MRYSGCAMRSLVLLASTLLLAAPAIAQTAEGRCANLQQLTLDQAHVLSAEVVARGTFVAPPRPTGPNEQVALYKQLPAFCRVKVQAMPTSDSNIQIEVWLPLKRQPGTIAFRGRAMAALPARSTTRHSPAFWTAATPPPARIRATSPMASMRAGLCIIRKRSLTLVGAASTR